MGVSRCWWPLFRVHVRVDFGVSLVEVRDYGVWHFRVHVKGDFGVRRWGFGLSCPCEG